MNHSHVSIQHHMHDDSHHHQSGAKPEMTIINTHDHVHSADHYALMNMYFHGGYNATILFESWTTTSISLFIISCIFLFISGILYEAIRQLRQCLEEEKLMKKTTIVDNENKFELEPMSSQPNSHSKEKIPLRFGERFSLSLLYIVHLAFGYLLMLVIMTFNTYLFLTIILGIGTGHFFLTWITVTPQRKTNQTHI